MSAEQHTEARTVLDALGRQLVAGWTGVAAVEGPGGELRPAVHAVQRSLSAWRVLVVVDNLEMALEDPDPALLPLLAEVAATGESRLLVTSREPPTGLTAAALRLGRLAAADGKALVEGVLKARGLEPPAEGDAAVWVGRLVEVVRGHPRALVLLAPEVARRGLAATHDELVPLIEALDEAAGTDAEKRENSLLASVRLSLRRLSAEERRLARGLAVFRQAAEVQGLTHVLQVPPEEAARLCGRLVELGLGESHETGPLVFFLPDAALGLALARGLGGGEALVTEERAALEARWFESVVQLVLFLIEQQDLEDARVAVDAARVALGELLAWIEAAEARVEAGALTADEATQLVGGVEGLLVGLGRRRALERVVAARRRLAAAVDVGTHAEFVARGRDVERALQAGDLPLALELADVLHRNSEALGDDFYPEAAYDRAMAANLLARVLQAGGAPDRALSLLETARDRFLALAEGEKAAAAMAAACLTKQGDCLCDLGQLDAAAQAYEAALADDDAAGRTQTTPATASTKSSSSVASRPPSVSPRDTLGL